MNVGKGSIGKVRINLRRGDLGMPQKHLHRAQIRAALEKISGKGVTQAMGRYLFGDARG